MTAEVLVSLVVVVDDAAQEPDLRRTLDSIAQQDDPRWEAVVVTSARMGETAQPTGPGFRTVVTPDHGPFGAELPEVSGEYVAILACGDELRPEALRRCSVWLDSVGTVDILYTDEELVAPDGYGVERSFKPDWSPERLRNQLYVGRLTLVRTALAVATGDRRPGTSPVAEHDLLLRLSEHGPRVLHVPEVLVRRNQAPAGRGDHQVDPDVVAAHLRRTGLVAAVETMPDGALRIRRPLPAHRRVSIVIPTRGSVGTVAGRDRVLVLDAVASALARTDHRDVEVVVVHDLDTPGSVLEDLQRVAAERLVLVPFAEEFNFSRKVNLGALHASGDRLVFLNDDVEVQSSQWLEELVAPLEEESVGATGAKLFYQDGTVQHAGIAFLRDTYRHPYRFAPPDARGAGGILAVDHEVSGVTGACLAIRREVFYEIGGFTERLPGSFNDVDLCYKISRTGRRILLMVHCELHHYESISRNPTVLDRDISFMRDRWGTPERDAFMPVYPGMPPSARPRKALPPAAGASAGAGRPGRRPQS